MSMTILLVDDHQVVLEGIKSLLQVSIPGAQIFLARTTQEATCVLQSRKVDALVCDLELKQDSGMAFVRTVRATYPSCRIVIHTMHEEPWTAGEILDFDPDAVVMKSDDSHELVKAVEAVMEGDGYYSTSFCRILHTLHRQPARLTEREGQVLDMTANGFSISDTAQALYVTPSTVEFHRRRIMQKLQAQNVADMIRKAASLGWSARI